MPQYSQIQIQYLGGRFSALNVTAAKVIKASNGGTLFRIIVQTAGSAGSLTINDNTALGGTNTAANTLCSIPFGNLTSGRIIKGQWPCANGIVVSSMPTGGVIAVSYT